MGDECRITSDGCYDSVGQNIGYIGTSRYERGASVPDWGRMIQMWYDEVKDYTPELVPAFASPDSGAVVGHFTQVVWAKTHRVGCGYIVYFKKNMYYQYYVCNYAKGGNWMGAPVYLKGKACENCPSNSKCNKSLCKLN